MSLVQRAGRLLLLASQRPGQIIPPTKLVSDFLHQRSPLLCAALVVVVLVLVLAASSEGVVHEKRRDAAAVIWARTSAFVL